MKQSTCGAVFCQPGGDELKHDIRTNAQNNTCYFYLPRMW